MNDNEKHPDDVIPHAKDLLDLYKSQEDVLAKWRETVRRYIIQRIRLGAKRLALGHDLVIHTPAYRSIDWRREYWAQIVTEMLPELKAHGYDALLMPHHEHQPLVIKLPLTTPDTDSRSIRIAEEHFRTEDQRPDEEDRQ